MNDPRRDPWFRLRIAAWLAFAVHLAAALAMAAVIRRGLETNPDLAGRLRFLTENTVLWLGGWLIWNAATLAILYFFMAFAAAHADGASQAPLRYAVLLCTAAFATDLAAEAIEMGVLPGLARQVLEGGDVAQFHVMHRTAVMLTGYLANGLYSLAVLLASWTTRAAYARWVWGAGIAVGALGIALSGMTLVAWATGMAGATAALMTILLLWLAGVARTAGQHGMSR